MKSQPELKNDVATEDDVEDVSAPWLVALGSSEVSGFSTMGFSSILGEFFELLAVENIRWNWWNEHNFFSI